MPVVVPPFVQYQAPLPPLRGLWNQPPNEGDRFVAAEIDWGVTVPSGEAVQFALSGNSPVALSQIVAMWVDNSNAGADVAFLFPDTASQLKVPARTSGVFPVFTNALMFYALAPNAVSGDVTRLLVFNSMPPPVPVAPTQESAAVVYASMGLGTGSTVQLIPSPTNGTIQGGTLVFQIGTGAAAESCTFTLQDATHVIFSCSPLYGASTSTTLVVPLPVGARFTGGLSATVGATTIAGGNVAINLDYTSP